MDDLKRLQAKELDMLKEIDKACNTMNLKYVISFGTLLGAIRHKGFIPWDDDVDICMPREDYDIFIKHAEEYLSANLKVQHFTTEKDCPNIYAKIRDVNTVFLAKEHVDLQINQGVFIDVFPVECVKNSHFSCKWEAYMRRFFNVVNNCYDMAYVNTIQRKKSKIIAYLIRFFIIKGIFHGVSKHDYIHKEDSRRKKKHLKNLHQMSMITYTDSLYAMNYDRFFEREKYVFEDCEFWGPKYYDEILSGLYGDYMKLPPEDKRAQHTPLYMNLECGMDQLDMDSILSLKK